MSHDRSEKPSSTSEQRAGPEDPTDEDGRGRAEPDEDAGAQISEAGGATLNEETSEGGADAVPDAHG